MLAMGGYKKVAAAFRKPRGSLHKGDEFYLWSTPTEDLLELFLASALQCGDLELAR